MTTRDAVVVTPAGSRIPVQLHTADGMRMTPGHVGLTSTPRHLIGAIEIPHAAYTQRGDDPAPAQFVDAESRSRRSP